VNYPFKALLLKINMNKDLSVVKFKYKILKVKCHHIHHFYFFIKCLRKKKKKKTLTTIIIIVIIT